MSSTYSALLASVTSRPRPPSTRSMSSFVSSFSTLKVSNITFVMSLACIQVRDLCRAGSSSARSSRATGRPSRCLYRTVARGRSTICRSWMALATTFPANRRRRRLTSDACPTNLSSRSPFGRVLNNLRADEERHRDKSKNQSFVRPPLSIPSSPVKTIFVRRCKSFALKLEYFLKESSKTFSRRTSRVKIFSPLLAPPACFCDIRRPLRNWYLFLRNSVMGSSAIWFSSLCLASSSGHCSVRSPVILWK
mmetsp:Transcript_6816/g.12129  ORF Transcript_6816/g.12129 Transcript_6816/m.12129 type:complete len:250 (+) Transcript_6816:714-1463(+)